MAISPKSTRHKRWPLAMVTGGLLLGGAAVGAVGVAAANAAPELAAATPAPSASSKASQRASETPVTGSKAATLKAAALKAVPGATVLRIETDSDGAAYEVHLKKTDGTRVTVKFNAALQQTTVETDTGRGGHGHRGDETEVTGATATTLKAAALNAVSGATVLRVEKDADGAVYEVHLKKADGTYATVKFDAALKQTGIETGSGHGGHHGHDRSTPTE